MDVIWTELIAKSMTLDQVKAYCLLRGSRLSSEDKKRVLVESGAETEKTGLEWSCCYQNARLELLPGLHWQQA